MQLALYILVKGRNYGNSSIPLMAIYEKVEELSTCPETKKQLKGNWWDKYCQIVIVSCVSDGFFIHDEQRKTVRVTHEGRTRFRRAKNWVREQTFNTPAEKIVALGLRLYTHEAGPAKKLNKVQLMHENVRLRHRVRDLEREHEVEEPVMSTVTEGSIEDLAWTKGASPEHTTVLESSEAPVVLKTPVRRPLLADAAAPYPSPESAPRPRRPGATTSPMKREATAPRCIIQRDASSARLSPFDSCAGPQLSSTPPLPHPRSASLSPSPRELRSHELLATPGPHVASPDITRADGLKSAFLTVPRGIEAQAKGACTWFEQVLADNVAANDGEGGDTTDDEMQPSPRRCNEGAFEKQQLYKRQQRMQKEIEELREVEEILKGKFGAIARSAQRRGWKPY